MSQLLQGYCTLVLLALVVHHQLLLAGGKHPTHLTVELSCCRRPVCSESALVLSCCLRRLPKHKFIFLFVSQH